MAALIVPDIRDEKVVCQGPCEHRDCAELRKWDQHICRICGKGFEPGQRFYIDREDKEYCGSRRLPRGRGKAGDLGIHGVLALGGASSTAAPQGNLERRRREVSGGNTRPRAHFYDEHRPEMEADAEKLGIEEIIAGMPRAMPQPTYDPTITMEDVVCWDAAIEAQCRLLARWILDQELRKRPSEKEIAVFLADFLVFNDPNPVSLAMALHRWLMGKASSDG